jgi:glycosyltransferase involved in cell wall biosynthesis
LDAPAPFGRSPEPIVGRVSMTTMSRRLRRMLEALKDLLRLPASEQEVLDALSGRTVRPGVERQTRHLEPRDAWHSWDPAPWTHPWLTPSHLEAARGFQERLLGALENEISEEEARAPRYGFTGNLANNMAMRALPLRRQGYDIDIVLHPGDRYVMSQPGWERSDATLPDGVTDLDRLRALGFELPAVDGVVQTEVSPDGQALSAAALAARRREWRGSHPAAAYLRQRDALMFSSFMGYLPTLEALRAYDAVFAAQSPYLAYLSGRPYLAAQTGGDLWLESARDDAFGRLQRRSYAKAGAILATNPWAYAHARRYGFDHVLYVPLLIDSEIYSPGPSTARASWEAEVGGDFFVLATARVDSMWKGSEVGLDGFCQFATHHPGARLVLVGWGDDQSEALETLGKRGLAERTVLLPISGKRKVVEYLRAADCLLDQFKIGYYGATALEAMACGLPVVMRLLTEQYDALCPTGAPPVLNASTADEVAMALSRLAGSMDDRRDAGAKSHRWIENNHSVDVWGRHYGALLSATARGRSLDFGRSPLRQPLGPDEVAYHQDMLKAAPPFPEYRI